MARAWLEDPTAGKAWLLVLDSMAHEITTMVLPICSFNGRADARTVTIPDRPLTIALRPPGIDDVAPTAKADLERLVRSVGNLPLAIHPTVFHIR